MFQVFLKKRNSIVFSWITAFLLVIVLFVGLFMVIFLRMQSSLIQEINASNGHIAQHTKLVLDTTIKNITTSASQIAMDNKVRSLLYKQGELEDSDYYDAYEIITMLRQARALNGNIEVISIVDIPGGRVYSTEGSTKLETFYGVWYKKEGRSYQEWLKLFEQPATNFFFSSEEGMVNGRSTEHLHYVRSLRNGGVKDMSRCIIFTIAKETLLSNLEGISEINQSNLYIVDSNGEVILASTEECPDFEKKSGNSGSFEQRFSDGRRVVLYQQSDLEKWDYYVSFKKSELLGTVKMMWYYCVIGILVMLAVSFVLIRNFVKKNYLPIQNLIGMFSDQELVAEMDENEYQVIENFVSRTMATNGVLDRKLNQQKRMLRQRALERFIKGTPGIEGKTWEETLKKYDVCFLSSDFVIMLFSVSDITETVSEIQEHYDYYETFFIVSNVIEEMVGEKDRGFMTECDGFIACVVNLKPEHIENYEQALKAIVEQANVFVSKNFGFSFTVSISSVVSGIEAVPDGYREALDVMQYMEALCIEETMCFGEMPNSSEWGSFLYNYPRDVQQRLVGEIQAGNYNEAVKTVDSIFSYNVAKKLVTPETIKYVLISIVSTVAEALNEQGVEPGTDVGELLPLEKFLDCKTVPEMKEALYKCLENVCGRTVSMGRQEENWVKRDVVPYVLENYADINLSVSSIAGYFEVHPVYLSRLFKAQMGEGLLDFITNLRVDKAREILKESRVTLEETASRVGYTNARTFSRAFKKVTGMTPGKFRTIQK